MTTAPLALPRHGARLRAMAGKASRWVRAVAVAAVVPHRASLRRLGEIPLTVAGTALADAAFFQVGSLFAGLIVTGISLVVVEHMIADPEDSR